MNSLLGFTGLVHVSVLEAILWNLNYHYVINSKGTCEQAILEYICNSYQSVDRKPCNNAV